MDRSRAAGAPSHLDIDITTNGSVARVTLRGETDISNHGQLRSALASVDLGVTQEVHLAMADLTFCDVRAVCELLTFAQSVRDSGGEVFILDANPLVLLMATLLEVDGELGLRDGGHSGASAQWALVPGT